MSEGRRGGERRRHAPPSARTRRTHERSSHALRGQRPSLGPSTRARRSSLCSAAQASEVGRTKGHRGRANPRKREEPAPGFRRTDGARLAACHRSRTRKGREAAWHDEEKGGDRGLRPCEERESGFGCPHVVVQLQKSVGGGWSRISSANALQKERPGSSERGPSSERGSAGDTVGSRIERNARRTSASPRKSGEDRRSRPRVTRDRHPAVVTSRKRWGGRGTGAVMATGSYEGSLPAEGTPDHQEASAFTRRRRRWSRRQAHPPTRAKPPPPEEGTGRTARLQQA